MKDRPNIRVQETGWTYDFNKIIMSKIKSHSHLNRQLFIHHQVASNPERTGDLAHDQSSQLARDDKLNSEILRIKSIETVKLLERVWTVEESELIEFLLNLTTIYQLIDTRELITMPDAKTVRTQNRIYFGQIHNKFKHGKGLTIYRDGRVYEGTYFQNQKEGKGCEIYSNGNMYVGDYHQNKKHGKGTFYWFTLSEPAGTKEQTPKVEQYQGMWWGGLPDGQGQYEKANGDFYLGHFKNGLKHGQGVEYYSNGDKYSGQFVNGLPEGFGEYVWVDGSYYRGDFKQGYRNGYGVWHSSNESQNFKGHYMLDRKHGYGLYNWGNGYTYKGNFIQDQRFGQGQLYFQDQLVYSGYWAHGQKCDEEQFWNQQLQSKTANTAASRHSGLPQKKKRSNAHINHYEHKDESFMLNFKHTAQKGTSNCYACKQRQTKDKKGSKASVARQGKISDKKGRSLSRGRVPF